MDHDGDNCVAQWIDRCTCLKSDYLKNTTMKIGLIGLGKMGYNLALNFASKGFDVVAYDSDKNKSGDKIKIVQTIDELGQALPQQKIIWLMVPANGAVDSVIN